MSPSVWLQTAPIPPAVMMSTQLKTAQGVLMLTMTAS